MDDGDDLLASGSVEEALDRYRRADRIMGVPTTRIAVAHALAKLGRLREARTAAVETQKMPAVAKEPSAFREARQEAVRLERELSDRIPTLEVTVLGLRQGAEATVLIDGQSVSADEAADPVELDPGRHEIVVQVPDSPPMTQQVDLKEGERRTIVMTATSTQGSAQTEPPGATPTLAYVGLGVGAAGVTVGAVTGLIALRRSTDLEDQCGGTTCPTRYDEDIESARGMAKVSNVAFGIGLAGIAVGVGALVFGADDEEQESEEAPRAATLRLVPDVGPLRIGVRGAF